MTNTDTSGAECKQTVIIHACCLVMAVNHHVAQLYLITKPGCDMRIPSQKLNPNREHSTSTEKML